MQRFMRNHHLSFEKEYRKLGKNEQIFILLPPLNCGCVLPNAAVPALPANSLHRNSEADRNARLD